MKALRTYKKVKKDFPDFKLILGNEIYLCRNGLNSDNFVKGQDYYYHFILLAKNEKGHEQIRELSTRAWKRSYKTGLMRRVPTYYQDIIDIIGSNPGNVIASTACLGGLVAKQLINYRDTKSEVLYNNILNWLRKMDNLFGKGNFYLELQPSASKDQTYVNRELINISKKLDIPYIITCDTHYLNKEDDFIHEAYLNAQDGDREVKSFYATTYLMTTELLEEHLELIPEELQIAYDNIVAIREKCEDYSLSRKLRIPSLAWVEYPDYKQVAPMYYKDIPHLQKFVESDYHGDNVLANAVIHKVKINPDFQNKQVYDALEDNLEKTWVSSEVNETHWSAYFLNLQKIIQICWEAGTFVGPGRGSGVGFFLLYLLDIIQINPLWEDVTTFSFRFLNPSRVSVLDIDTDIEGSKRADVLAAFRKFYGEENVANVSTFRTEKSKAAILTAARGVGIDVDVAQYLAAMIPSDRGATRTLDQCMYGDAENEFPVIEKFAYEMTNTYPELWEIAHRIEGLICGTGIHAGGIIFVDEPFTKSTALMRAPDGTICTQFDLHDSEDMS